MAREYDLIGHVPDVYAQIEEIQEILRVETLDTNALWVNTENIYNDAFIVTSTDYGLDRRYNFLNMPIIPGEDRETRIFKLLARYQEQAPYTWEALLNLLNGLLGEGNYLASRNVGTKILEVKLELTQSGQYNAVVDLLERIVPQNMVINISLRYNTWNQVKALTWNQVKTKTWDEIKEGVL